MPRPRIAALLVFAVLGPVLLLASSAYGDGDLAAAENPTITFTSTGTIPVVCSTRPNVSSLTVKVGTRIFFANLTGTSASIDLGQKDPVSLANGTGALVMLRKGVYNLRMVPDCVVVEDAEPVAVNVVPAAPPSGAPSPSPSLSASPNPSPGQVGPAASQSPTAPPEAPGTTTPVGSGASGSPGALVAPTAGSSGRGQPAAGPGAGLGPNTVANDSSLTESRVLEVRPVPFGPTNDPKGSRLLALIATICVFGVTAAIIRAILAQRTSSALNT
jgi:hypothetical protein